MVIRSFLCFKYRIGVDAPHKKTGFNKKQMSRASHDSPSLCREQTVRLKDMCVIFILYVLTLNKIEKYTMVVMVVHMLDG